MSLEEFIIKQPPRLNLDDFIPLMGDRNRPAIKRILDEHRELFRISPGSRKNHHSWEGGYWDHITECLNLAVSHYTLWNAMRPRPYQLWEALEVLFLHDLEKPWKYTPHVTPPVIVRDLSRKEDRAQFRLDMINLYGISLNSEQQNALKYCEGELGDYKADTRMMRPLAHLCHTCDETSARQWPDYPDAAQDEWIGASRVSASS